MCSALIAGTLIITAGIPKIFAAPVLLVANADMKSLRNDAVILLGNSLNDILDDLTNYLPVYRPRNRFRNARSSGCYPRLHS